MTRGDTVVSKARRRRHPVTHPNAAFARHIRRLVAVLGFYAICSGWCWVLHIPEAAARSDGLWAFVVFGDRVDDGGRIHPFAKFPFQIGAWQLVAICWVLIAVQVSLLLARWRGRTPRRDAVVTRWVLGGAIAMGMLTVGHAAAEIVYLVTDRPITMVTAATVVVAVVPIELACLGLFARWLARQARLHADMPDRVPPARVSRSR